MKSAPATFDAERRSFIAQRSWVSLADTHGPEPSGFNLTQDPGSVTTGDSALGAAHAWQEGDVITAATSWRRWSEKVAWVGCIASTMRSIPIARWR